MKQSPKQNSFHKQNLRQKLRTLFLPCKENGYEARILKTDFLFTFIITVFILRIAFLPFYAYLPQNLFFAEVISSDIVSLLNQQRVSESMTGLSLNTKLIEAAELKAQDMLEKDYFAHKSPEGLMAWDFIEQTGYEYSVAGENLAIGFLDSSEVHKAWNNSPLHKRNLLDPRFTDIGVAVASGEFKGKTTTVVVQIFAQPAYPASAAAAEQVAETPPQPAETDALTQTAPTQTAPTQTEPTQTTTPAPTPTPEQELAMREQASVSQKNESESTQAGEITEQETVISAPETEGPFAKVKRSFFEFLIRDYDTVARRTVMGIGGAIGAVVAINFIALLLSPLKNEIKRTALKNLFTKGAAALSVLLLLAMVDKTLIIQLIPHTLEI